MKALVLKRYNELAYEDVAEPQVGPDDLLVRVRACGICGSDVVGLDGSTGRRIPPLIMGHEAAGIIEAVGSNVAAWQAGERVTFDSTISCSKCYFCQQGLANLCDNRRVLGVSCAEFRRDGAFAEYVAVPQHIVYRLPDSVTFAQAAMVEAISVAVHAVGRAPIALNDTAVVVGAGMIGLLVVQALRLAGCGQIIAVDVDEGRLALARSLGAGVGLQAGAEVAAEVQRLTGGRGADLAYEVVGLTPTVQTALASVRKGGSLVLVGNAAPAVELPLQSAVSRQISLYGSCASNGEYPACLSMLARGAVRVEPITSALAPLGEGAAWFDRLRRREPGLMKVILEP